MWSLDRVGITDPIHVSDDDRAAQHFQSTVRFTDGRYEVQWPWRAANLCLPENYALAVGRLRSLCSRFVKDPQLLSSYSDVIAQQVDRGIIERVTPDSVTGSRVHYLPHQPVLTPSKMTTKLRVVYDASAKARRNNLSLNDCLHRGPVLLPNLCGILLRFRLDPIAITSDIEKAFLQLAIHPPDRDVTRFLWFRDTSTPVVTKSNLQIYRFTRVPFGLISSPFLLQATVRHHLQSEGSPLAQRILRNIYVDNVVLGAGSVEEAVSSYHQAKATFQLASMNLREWLSNSSEVMAHFGPSDVSNTQNAKVLGLSWAVQTDTLSLPAVKIAACPANITKRHVVQEVCRIYDPLGWASPIVFHGRMFLQRLWSQTLGWDDTLSPDLSSEWSSVRQVLNRATEIVLPRWLGTKYPGQQFELHIFSDASASAYATVAYLRILSLTGDHLYTHLLFSKLRLAPQKLKLKTSATLSIPRLELMGVLIGCRLSTFLLAELSVDIAQCILWTDSACVLSWLQSKKCLSPFVTRRVEEIRASNHLSFRHVPGTDNPADLPTRGATLADLSHSSLWWHGPECMVIPLAGFMAVIYSSPFS